MNKPCLLEPKLQKMEKEMVEVVEEHWRREKELATLPPVEIKSCPIRGYYVIAATAIPSLTLIAEYVGAVRTQRQTLFSNNDSIMNFL